MAHSLTLVQYLIFVSCDTVSGALSSPHTSRAPGFATRNHAHPRYSDAAQGNTQAMEATSDGDQRIQEGVLHCQGCSVAPAKVKPPRPTDSIFQSDCHLPAMDSTDMDSVTFSGSLPFARSIFPFGKNYKNVRENNAPANNSDPGCGRLPSSGSG